MFFFFPKSRKGLIFLLSVLFVICAAAAVFTYLSWSSDQQALASNGQPDFNTLPQDELKDGLIVKGTIDFVLGVCAEEYGTTIGIRTDDDSKKLYYIIPVYHTDEQGYITFDYLLTYEADPEDFEVMNTILDSEEIGLTVLNVENARIQSLPGELKQYITEWTENPEIWGGGTFYDWAVETDIFETDDRAVIESKLVPFMLDRTATAGTDPVIVWIFAGAAGLCLIILVIVLLRKKPINGIIDNTGNPDVMRPKQ